MQTFPAPASARILLVDDNRHGLIARKALLGELGYDVTTASDGEEALELYLANPFQLLITDYRMPKLDGAELIRRVRAVQPGAKIILVSGFVEPLYLTEQTTGADVVIAKNSAEVATLLRAVARLFPLQAKKPISSIRRTLRARPQNG